MDKFNLKSGYILTLDEEDEIDFEAKKIDILLIRKWILKG